MTFNVNKTVCMIFKPVNSRYAICDIFSAFNASGQLLSFVIQYKYLGHVIRNDLCDDKDVFAVAWKSVLSTWPVGCHQTGSNSTHRKRK